MAMVTDVAIGESRAISSLAPSEHAKVTGGVRLSRKKWAESIDDSFEKTTSARCTAVSYML